jgi:hypothetical protein
MCVLPMFTKGGQHGYQHSSDHRPLSAASRWWRLVRPRALVLGVVRYGASFGFAQRDIGGKDDYVVLDGKL